MSHQWRIQKFGIEAKGLGLDLGKGLCPLRRKFYAEHAFLCNFFYLL